MQRALQVALTLFAFSGTAEATYSIVAADLETGQVGGAGTSCLDGSDVSIIYGAASGFGVVHAQAWFNRAARDHAVALLAMGERPSAIIETITASGFDRDFTFRQYAIASADGATSAYTGSETHPFAAHAQGTIGAVSYSVQGNFLTSSAVLSNAASGFEEPACDLAERLMRALEAGAENGEGDRRCTDDRGIPSDSAFLRVEQGNAGPPLALSVSNSKEHSPLPMLRDALAAWRQDQPCVPPELASGGTGTAGANAMPTPTQSGSTSGCRCVVGASPSVNVSERDSSRANHRSGFALLALGGLLLGRRLGRRPLPFPPCQ